MKPSETFAAWLRAARKEAGVSQRVLGEHIGGRQTTIAKIEAGNRPLLLDEAAALAEFFGVSLGSVLAGASPETPAAAVARAQVALSASALEIIRLRSVLNRIHAMIEAAGGQQ